MRAWRAATAAAIFSAVGFSYSAQASASVAVQPDVVATFDGQQIDLADGWGGAQACLIWQSHGVDECFATQSELQAEEAQLRPGDQGLASSPDSSPTCSSSLNLYTGGSYTGRELVLWDEGVWMNLSPLGFDNSTVSFIGGACAFHLAQGNYGEGYWYPGNTGAWAFASDMGSWDRTVSSVYID